MKTTFGFCALSLVLLTSAHHVYGDVPSRVSPSPSPSPNTRSKVVFHTGLTVVPDANVAEARLQISQETLGYIRAAMSNQPVNESTAQRIAHSSARTMIAGFSMFLSLAFGGVWLARSKRSRGHKAIAAVFLAGAVLGAAEIITSANAGPPGYARWSNLPQALSAGRATQGGLDIEIVPEGVGMKLIMPIRSAGRHPGEE